MRKKVSELVTFNILSFSALLVCRSGYPIVTMRMDQTISLLLLVIRSLFFVPLIFLGLITAAINLTRTRKSGGCSNL